MKNILDATHVIALRRQGFYQLISEKLTSQNVIFDQKHLFQIIKNLDNMSLLTNEEKQNKKIKPMITAVEVSRENPSLLNIIIHKLEE